MINLLSDPNRTTCLISPAATKMPTSARPARPARLARLIWPGLARLVGPA